MQQFKSQFTDPAFAGTIANIQTCLRLGDLAEIGDGIHALSFNMMGLFSFRELSMPQAIRFWLEFLDQINASPDYVTIHPERMAEWSRFYPSHIPIRPDPGCTWSDGSISGFCTEFYKSDIEIGNIVNPLGTCIDVGFGLERLDMIVHGTPPATPQELLVSAIEAIIEARYRPGNKEHGYVLRKLLRQLYRLGGSMTHAFFQAEVARQEKLRDRYQKLLPLHGDKSPEWWFDTHGIDVRDMQAGASASNDLV
jgi:alanyl-tRNA synthetase